MGDVEFMRDIIDEFEGSQHGLDTDRVFDTGYSSGGQMSLRLGL